MSQRIKRLEEKLSAQERHAAQLLADNQFGLLSEDGKKLSMQEIADKVGIARSTLYEWKKNKKFVALENEYAEHMLNAHRSEIYGLIIKGARGHNGIPSSKMVEIFMKHYALLTDKQVIEDNREEEDRHRKSDAEIAREIDELNKLINGE